MDDCADPRRVIETDRLGLREFVPGTATESACMRWAFEHPDVGRVISLVHPDNAASRAVAERLHSHVQRVLRRGEDCLMFFAERND